MYLWFFFFFFFFFFFNDTATTEIYTLSLHDALPISAARRRRARRARRGPARCARGPGGQRRSEEHTSELLSRQYLVCRLLLEKKKRFARSRAIDPHRRRRFGSQLGDRRRRVPHAPFFFW